MLDNKLTCRCAQLQNVTNFDPGDDDDNYFLSKIFTQLDYTQLRLLQKCSHCGVLWSVDNHGRGGLAIKLSSAVDFKSVRIKSSIVPWLTMKYGGLADSECCISGCNGKSLSKIKFCSNCAITRFGYIDETV